MEIKKYIAQEIASKLGDSDYFFLANYEKITVLDVQDLRERLSVHGARFHVVKNRLFSLVLNDKGMSVGRLKGPTALVCGGANPPGVAKVLKTFIKEKNRLSIKSGFLSNSVISREDVNNLADLPSLDVLRSQFLALLNTPATQFVRICKAVPESMARVLQAQVDKMSA